MTGLWLDLLGYGWELVVIGFILVVGIAIFAHSGIDAVKVMCLDCDGLGWYRGREGIKVPCPTCGSSGYIDEEDGEEFPEDPDRQRDWDIADEMGAY